MKPIYNQEGKSMNRVLIRITALLLLVLLVGAFAKPATVRAAADDEVAIAAMSDEASFVHSKGWAAGITIAIVAGAGALSMGLVIWKTIEGIARQPEAEGKIRTAMMLGLVFVETAIIYALIVAIMIIFVL